MNEGEIIELFVKAAEVNRRLPDTGRPAKLKAMNFGYVHSFADMNGWDEDEKRAANWDWLDPAKLKLTTKDIGIWEAALEVIKLVPDPNKRRALWAWAKAEAGGQPFAKWCKKDGNGNGEGISRQLGDWRRKEAISQISRAFARKPLQHNDKCPDEGFTNQPEIGDKSTTIRVLRPDDAKPVCSFDEDLQDFSWAKAQWERRKARETRKPRRAA